MIDLYTWSSPNGSKVQIMLEETGLDFELHPVNLGEGEQNKSDYLAINPNGKIPAIVDRDGPWGDEVTVFESGAILLYLAEKSGKFLPEDPANRPVASDLVADVPDGRDRSLSRPGRLLPEPGAGAGAARGRKIHQRG